MPGHVAHQLNLLEVLGQQPLVLVPGHQQAVEVPVPGHWQPVEVPGHRQPVEWPGHVGHQLKLLEGLAHQLLVENRQSLDFLPRHRTSSQLRARIML